MLSDKQVERLDYIIASCTDAQDSMSQWHQEFLCDIITKYARYGVHLILTTRQWDVLEDILDLVKHV